MLVRGCHPTHAEISRASDWFRAREGPCKLCDCHPLLITLLNNAGYNDAQTAAGGVEIKYLLAVDKVVKVISRTDRELEVKTPVCDGRVRS